MSETAGRLRALAHPLRLHAIELLEQHGSLTATEIAAQTGATPSAMSYHLRHLARHGIIEHAPSDDGREVRWQLVSDEPEGELDPPSRGDVLALTSSLEQSLHRALERFRTIVASGQHAAATALVTTVWATPEQLAEVQRRIEEALDSLPVERPAGAADQDQKSVYYLAIPMAGQREAVTRPAEARLRVAPRRTRQRGDSGAMNS